jgi:hypothetical protein
MNRLPKILLVIFIISLIAAAGLGSYYFYLTNSSFSKTSFSIQSLPYRIGIEDRVAFESIIPNLNVQVTEKEKLEKAVENSGFWQKAVPAYGSFPSSLVKPISLKILLTNEEQSGFKVVEAQKDIEGKRASKSLGIEYDEKTGRITLFMHYSSNYIIEKTNEELAQEITKDVFYYFYAMGGDENITSSQGDIFERANDFAEDYLNKGESWLDIKKNG